jgi:hypothetical protein
MMIRNMSTRILPAGDLERAFVRAHEMQAELARRERAVGRKVQALARGLASLMEPGEYFHRIGVGLHAFEVDGTVCLAASYLEEQGEDSPHRYAVLCGGETARRALRTAALDPADSDEPGPNRRVALPTYSDFDDFLYRLPKYLGDVNHRVEKRLAEVASAENRIRGGRKQIATARRSLETAGPRGQRRQPVGGGRRRMTR